LQPVVDDLRPAGLFEKAAGKEYYSRILQILGSAGGYVAGSAGTPVTDTRPRYYVLAYDWRQDAIATVGLLDRLIEQVRFDYGQPHLQVDIIGHSMGGLIARYYARYGTRDLLDGNEFRVTHNGARKIRRLILVGTPNLGSVEAMHSLIVGANLGFRETFPEVVMTMPAIYQLFPHALHEWLYTTGGQALERDQFDAYIWKRFEMGPWNPALRRRIYQRMGKSEGQQYLTILEAYFHHHLERARRFTWSLSVPEPEGGVRPVIFGGDCDLTPARLVVEEVDGESTLRLWPKQIAHAVPGVDYETLMMEPGDGTVTKASLLSRNVLDPAVTRHPYLHFSASSVFFICERHDVLTSNITIQDNLLHVLLSVD
jgi:pimeloyl-ACP methyl ester carboxylesterase